MIVLGDHCLYKRDDGGRNPETLSFTAVGHAKICESFVVLYNFIFDLVDGQTSGHGHTKYVLHYNMYYILQVKPQEVPFGFIAGVLWGFL